jgi:hypothetical protein
VAWSAVILLVLIAWGAQRRLTARYDVCVHVSPTGIRATGRLSATALTSLREFFSNDFTQRQRLTVVIRRRPNRTFDLRFIPDVSAGEKQQVRNFLSVHLSS